MPRPGYDDVVLVTGFPSFYARRMVQQILEREPRALVYVIVLAKFEAVAQEELAALPPEQRDRVIVIEGDAAAMDLGLSGAEFRQITREVDRIHHLAHASYVGVDRAVAETLNVRGAAEIIELSRSARSLKALVFHSTAHVAGSRSGVVSEDELDCGQSFRNVIEETRMRGEGLARRAMKDLPIVVVRPTTLVGDSGTGETGRLDGPYLLVLLIVASPAEIAIPLPTRGDHPLSIIPIDFAVRASHALGRDPRAIGRTFHLADPSPLSSRRVFELVALAGGKRAATGHIPSNISKVLLRTPGIERFLRSPRSLVDELSSAVRYDTRNADELLKDAGITCPPFESYVDQLVARVQEHVRTRREKRDEPDAAEWDVGEDPLP